MRQLGMFDASRSLSAPPGELLVSYGGGVNTAALLVLLVRFGIRPRAITMADPGAEWRATHRYRDEVIAPYLERHGFPPVQVIRRWEEGRQRSRVWRHETLAEECERIQSLPSTAYGFGKCSQKYKGEPQRWWTARQEWARAEWAGGRRTVRAIGYDIDESGRVLSAFLNPWEAKRFTPWYPVHEAGLDREGCEELLRSEGLPVPGKSACTFCPNNTLEDWKRLRVEEPEAFASAVAMSRRAQLEAPEVVGLMRCNEHGKRQLHVWSDGGYGDPARALENPQPCECAL